MSNVKTAFRICGNNFRKWTGNYRICILGILLAMFLLYNSRNLIDYCYSIGVSISPWVFPFYVSHYNLVLLFMFGIIFLFCDAPFLDSSQPYYLIRSGRKTWVAGQILYLFFASAAYFIYIAVLSILFLLPVLRIQAGWGKVITTLTYNYTGLSYRTLEFSEKILEESSPAQAMILSLTLNILIGFLLGLLLFCVNLKWKRLIGSIAASIPVLFTRLAALRLPLTFSVHYFSPVSWASLGNIALKNVGQLPAIAYIFPCLAGISMVLIILIFLIMRKKEIETLPDI